MPGGLQGASSRLPARERPVPEGARDTTGTKRDSPCGFASRPCPEESPGEGIGSVQGGRRAAGSLRGERPVEERVRGPLPGRRGQGGVGSGDPGGRSVFREPRGSRGAAG